MKKVVKIIIVIAVLGGLVGLTYLLSGNMEQVFSSSTVYSVKNRRNRERAAYLRRFRLREKLRKLIPMMSI